MVELYIAFPTVLRFAMTIACAIVCLLQPYATQAQDRPPEPRVFHPIDRYPYFLWGEAWYGGEMQARAWTLYSGATIALSGDIEDPGWRLRTTGGYGQYSYRKLVPGVGGHPESIKFRGHKSFSDLLVGYQFNWDRLIWKAFGGLNTTQHLIDPRDPDNAVAQYDYGAKIAAEAWYSISDKAWVAGNASFATTFNAYKLGVRSGYRLFQDINIGLEARIEGDDEYHLSGRLGAFTTVTVLDYTVAVGAGMTGDRDMRTSPYANVSLYYRY